MEQKREPARTFPTGEAMDRAMNKILSVSHEEMQRRLAAYKERAALNPRKRGPKPKNKL